MVTSVCNSEGTRCGAMRRIIKLFDPDSVELKRTRRLRHKHCGNKGSTSLRHVSWTKYSPPTEVQGQNPFPPSLFSLCSSPNVNLHFSITYLDLSFDEGSDVILVLKDGERLQQVMFQPLPVLGDLFTGGAWREGFRHNQHRETLGRVQKRVTVTILAFIVRTVHQKILLRMARHQCKSSVQRRQLKAHCQSP